MTGKYLTDYEKGKIQGMKDCGIGVTQIALTMKRNIRTIMRLLKKARDLSPGHCPAVKPKTGRPRKVNAHGLLVMKKAFQKSPRKTLKHLKLDHPQLFGDVKVRTLNLACTRDLNMRARVAKKKPLLTATHKRKRLEFARKYRNWKTEQWKKVLWSDESTFRVNSESQKKVRRPVYKKGQALGNPYEEKYLQATVKHPPGTMVWGCFSGTAGRGSLYFVPQGKTINAKGYLENILKEKLLITLELHGAEYFQQDGASVHTAKIVRNWLNDQEFNVIDWPAQSPDLNPIENLWNEMKMKLEDYDTRSIPKLQDAIKKLWCRDMNLEEFTKYAASMPKRLALVIKNKGGTTKY